MTQGTPFKVTHGLTSHELYGTWCQIMARCYNPKNSAYKRYGGRGIYVCDRWHDITLFIADIERAIGSRPPDMTLDRKDNDGPYAEWNIQWATRKQQRANTRRPDRVPNRAHPLYHIWVRIRQKHPGEVCNRWMQFSQFAEDTAVLGPQPDGQVFRRIDWEMPFGPNNVCWGPPGRPGPRASFRVPVHTLMSSRPVVRKG
jgi:hypothetical protein